MEVTIHTGTILPIMVITTGITQILNIDVCERRGQYEPVRPPRQVLQARTVGGILLLLIVVRLVPVASQEP